MIKVEINFTHGKMTLERISVLEDHRGQGHASRAISFFQQIAENAGVEFVIENVLNPKLIQYCEKRGYAKRKNGQFTSYVYRGASARKKSAVPSHLH